MSRVANVDLGEDRVAVSPRHLPQQRRQHPSVVPHHLLPTRSIRIRRVTNHTARSEILCHPSVVDRTAVREEMLVLCGNLLRTRAEDLCVLPPAKDTQ